MRPAAKFLDSLDSGITKAGGFIGEMIQKNEFPPTEKYCSLLYWPGSAAVFAGGEFPPKRHPLTET